MTYGMQFGDSDAKHNPSYTTTQTRLQINLNNPFGKQFDVVTVPAGTAFSVNETVAQTLSEQLMVVTHGLGYKPQVYVVFSLVPIAGTQTPATAGYNEEEAILTSLGAVQDTITYTINNNTFTVVHTLSSNGLGTGSFTSTASQYNLQVKYLICNNKHIRTTTIN